MLVLVAAALILLVAGMAFLQSSLNPRVHPVWFILFWTTCGWMTLTALLLAALDLLMVRMEARKIERSLREKFAQSQIQDPLGSTAPNQSGLAKPFGVDD